VTRGQTACGGTVATPGHPATGCKLIATSPLEPFLVRLKIAGYGGIALSVPFVFWQVWRFVEPGLHAHEKKYAGPFVIVGSVLFILGGAFSLLIVTPSAVGFMLSYARPGLQPMISIGSYIDFLLKFTLGFGAVFEVPLAVTVAARMGLVTPKQLAKNRKYAILGAFIAGAILTPTPDMINQSLMAGPIILLYEIGIIAARIFGRARARPVPEPATGGTTA
jgi:sec-independent protein translocase protein TatC